MKKNYVVIGLGRFGTSVACELHKLNNDVLAIDMDEEAVKDISPYVTQALQLDATDQGALTAAGISNVDAAIVAVAGDIQSSIMITLLLKEIGVPYVAVKAQSDLHGKVLSKIGADRILFPEREMGVRFAHNLVSSCILEHIELSPEYSLIEINPLPNWFGHELKFLDLRTKYGINIMAIKKPSGELIITPNGASVIEDSSTLIVIGKNEDIRKLENLSSKKHK